MNSKLLPDLSEYSIDALLDMGVDPKTFCHWFDFCSCLQLLTLRISGLVHMTVSRGWEDRFSDNTNVVEVVNKKRKLTANDMREYTWPEDDWESMPEFVVINIYGSVSIDIICDSFDISLEPLENKYPYLT